jgi:metalloprotease
MRKLLILTLAALLGISCSQQYNSAYLLSGGAKILQAATLTDAQIQSYVGQYVHQLDSQSVVLPESNAYVQRVRKMTSNFTSVDGTPLNFKVYKTNEVNAFACADGSVRIYTGLLDAMTDDEVLGVVGHEIGHVALKHSKKQFKEALMSSALRDAVISTGGTVAVLSASQLGDLAESLLSASYSRKQETQADDYGYEFLKSAGKNPWAMAMAFEELQKLSGSDTASGTQGVSGISVSDLFSSHPATADRIERMANKATKDGYTRPSK